MSAYLLKVREHLAAARYGFQSSVSRPDQVDLVGLFSKHQRSMLVPRHHEGRKIHATGRGPR